MSIIKAVAIACSGLLSLRVGRSFPVAIQAIRRGRLLFMNPLTPGSLLEDTPVDYWMQALTEFDRAVPWPDDPDVEMPRFQLLTPNQD